jgi:DNA invertase Pin-like site-specific DNA recombinase
MQDQGIAPAILYAAKSTEDKHGSIPDQIVKARDLSEKEDWSMRGEFSDEGFSAYSGNRGPGLEEAKAAAIELAAEQGECLLVALHSDRVARGAGDEPGAAEHLVEVVAHLRRHGVRLRTVEDDFFADDRIGLLMAAVQGQRNSEDSLRKAESVRPV